MKSTSTDKISKQVASILYEIGSISFRPKLPFKYDSGILSPVYTDNRLIISYPNHRSKITKFLIEKIKEIGLPDVIAGTATAGIPHAAFIAQNLNLPMIYVRSKPKDHGKGNQIEGVLKRGQKVVIIEDLISTAGSVVNVAHAIREAGGTVSDVIAIFTYQMEEAKENLKKNKLKLHTLTNLKDSVDAAVKSGFLKQELASVMVDWSRNPKGWGKKMGFE